jgi:hypothetical protein
MRVVCTSWWIGVVGRVVPGADTDRVTRKAFLIERRASRPLIGRSTGRATRFRRAM